MSDFEPPPYGDRPAVPGPAEQLVGGAGTWPSPALATDVLPSAEPPSRRVGRSAVAATLAVLLVLLVGGAAYGWSVLQRADVRLARAFDATKAAPRGTMTLSITADGAAAATAGHLTASSLSYAWGPGSQQVTVVYDGKKLGTLTTTSTHLTLQVDPASLPSSGDLRSSLQGAGALLGDGAEVITALLDGRPVGIAVGPGSALQKALDQAARASGSASKPSLSPDAIAQVVDAITQTIRDNVTVTDAGSDQYGDHLVATLPLSRVVDAAWTQVSALVPAGTPRPDLAQVGAVTLQVDVWVRDGSVTRLEVPMSKVVPGAAAAGSGDARLVVVLSGEGVRPVVGPVTDVPDSLVGSLTGNG